jgi:hypothetical protein
VNLLYTTLRSASNVQRWMTTAFLNPACSTVCAGSSSVRDRSGRPCVYARVRFFGCALRRFRVSIRAKRHRERDKARRRTGFVRSCLMRPHLPQTSAMVSPPPPPTLSGMVVPSLASAPAKARAGLGPDGTYLRLSELARDAKLSVLVQGDVQIVGEARLTRARNCQ